MAGTFTTAVLADGQLPRTQGTLFTGPAVTVTYVKRISLFNTNAAAQTIQLWLNVGGTPRKWRRYVLNEDESAEVLETGDAIILEAGDTIEAITTTASAVDYYICGVKET
jgi:hypothetical protein